MRAKHFTIEIVIYIFIENFRIQSHDDILRPLLGIKNVSMLVRLIEYQGYSNDIKSGDSAVIFKNLKHL